MIDEIINIFADKSSKKRLLYLASKPKRWDDFQWDFFHDPRHFNKKMIHDYTETEIDLNEVKKLFDKTVYVLRPYEQIEEYSKHEVFDRIESEWFSEDFVFVYSQSNKTAFYLGHEGWKYIIKNR